MPRIILILLVTLSMSVTQATTINVPQKNVWEHIHPRKEDGSLYDTNIRSFAFAPTNPQLIYMTSLDPSATLFRSNDSGAHWQTIDIGENARGISAIGIAATDQNTIYAAGNNLKVYKSIDGGVTWTNSSTGLTQLFFYINALAIDPHDSAIVYLAVSGIGLLKSTDGGSSWNRSNTGIQGELFFDIVALPTSPTTLLMSTEGGVYKSTDAGANWIYASIGLPGGVVGDEVYNLAMAPVDSSTIYALTAAFGVFRSQDGGVSWMSVGLHAGLPEVRLFGLAVDPMNAATLYVGSDRKGVYTSGNGGLNWTSISEGLGTDSAGVLAVAPTLPSTVFASEEAVGLVKLVQATHPTQLYLPLIVR